jgi:PIN domain nuclease of toxin-antitoxin system
VLLDTHALLWWVADDRRLSRNAARAIARSADVLASPINFWEVATLVRLGRIALDRDVFAWISDVRASERLSLAPLSANAAATAGFMPGETFPGDPADRFLCAQARELAVPLVTKDRRLADYARATGELRTVW